MANYFITGASGFIGQHLIKHLLKSNNKLYCLTRSVSQDIPFHKNLNWIKGELADYKKYTDILKDTDYVIHLAGIINTRRPEEYHRVNFEGTKYLLKACLEDGVRLKKFLHMSSIAAVGPKSVNSLLTENDTPLPETEYGKSKYRAERLMFDYAKELPVVILRPSFIYGPGDIRGLKFLNLLSSQNELISFTVIETACLCHVADLVEACQLAIDKSYPSGEIFQISDPTAYTWRQINSILKKIVVELYPKNHENNFIFKRFFTNIPTDGKVYNIRKVRKFWGCDIRKAQNILDFNPKHSLSTGARETIKWYRDHNLYNGNNEKIISKNRSKIF